MMIKQFLFAIFILISLSACEKRSVGETKLKKGEFKTPNGSFKVEEYKETVPYRGHDNSFFVFVDDGDVTVRFDLRPKKGNFNIRHNKGFGKTFVFGSMDYTIQGQRFNYSLKRSPEYSDFSQRLKKPDYEHVRFSVRPNGPITNRPYSPENKDRIYDVVLQFTLDGKPYLFNVAYKIRTDSWYTIGIPGTGP